MTLLQSRYIAAYRNIVGLGALSAVGAAVLLPLAAVCDV
jgi:hypothetical protein